MTIADNGIGMSRDEVIDQHRHDREVGHPRVPPADDRRPGQGRPPDRPVRRRLLFLVHRGRPRHAHHAQGRPDGRTRRALGERRRGRLQHRHGRPRGSRNRSHPAFARGRGRPAPRADAEDHPPQVLGPHHHPDLHARASRSTRRPRCGPVPSPRSPTSSTPSSTSTSPTISRRRSRTRTRGSRASRSTRCCSTSPGGRPSTCSIPVTGTASSSTSAACSSWTTRTS